MLEFVQNAWGALARGGRQILHKEATSRHAGNPENRRQFHRYLCELPVELHLVTPGHLAILKAVARNISSGGMLLECPTLPAPMSACHVLFDLPDWGPFKAYTERFILAEARVQHCEEDSLTFGVAFSRPL